MIESKPAPLLLATGLGRRVGDTDRWLLQDIDVSVHAGERIAVLGPSGAGKSLLLRSLCLLDPWQAGVLHWRGQTLSHRDVPAFRSQVAYVRQRPASFEMTVEEFLHLPWKLNVYQARSFDRARVLRLLEMIARNESFLDKRGSELSGGEAQLAAILGTLQLEPTILLLDEPTAALDSITTSAVEQLLRGWLNDDAVRAAMWVTHDEAQSARIATRRMVLSNGRLVEGG